ncbi:MAG: ABC transporter ATP-binding protein [Candidatus Parcubacteria bacterium]|nr:ABC transporter ATP-binding protein [Candidatus Paceibacterota bacterium]
MNQTTKPTPISNSSFAWKYLTTEKTSFSLALLFVLINSGLQIATPEVIKYLINIVIPTKDYKLLLIVTVIMLGVFLIEGLIFRSQVKTVGYAAQRIMLKIRSNLFSHIQKLNLEFFNQNSSGDLISRINSDTTIVDNFLSQYIFAFTSSFFVFIGFGGYLAYLNLPLALLAYASIIIVIIISLFLRPIILGTNRRALEINGTLKKVLADNLNNYQVIQAYNIQNQLVQEFEVANLKAQQLNYHNRIFINFFNPIYNLAGNLALGIILGFILFSSGSLRDIGLVIAFVYAVTKFFGPLRELGAVFAQLAESVAALDRIRQILNHPVTDLFYPTLPGDPSRPAPDNHKLALEIKDLSFKYDNNPEFTLQEVTFEVLANSKLAIIGPTGEGKSTLAKLIAGLLEPTTGTLKVMGRDLKDWDREEFYNTVGFILQDPFLFSGSVASNIVYGNPKYEHYNLLEDKKEAKDSQNQLITSLIEDINVHRLDQIIPNLNEFLSVIVSNNSQNISQGQKQIINFIRVLLREPKLLILDEATANLDTVTEQYLQQALDNLTHKTTQIIIAHRQNTIKDANQILMVGGGRAVIRN